MTFLPSLKTACFAVSDSTEVAPQAEAGRKSAAAGAEHADEPVDEHAGARRMLPTPWIEQLYRRR